MSSSMQQAVSYHPRSVPLPHRIVAHAGVGAARMLATQPPRRIWKVLGMLRHGARPSSVDEATAARDTVVAISLACTGPEGCLLRSLATVLHCRMRSQWPTWF